MGSVRKWLAQLLTRWRLCVVQIDTQDVLFICGGAFAGLEHTINNRVSTASIGFGAVVRGKNALDSQKSQGDTYDKVEPTDLVGYGTSPEHCRHLPMRSNLLAAPLLRLSQPV